MKHFALPTLLLLLTACSLSANVSDAEKLEAKIDYALKLSLQNEVETRLTREDLKSIDCNELEPAWKPIGEKMQKMRKDVLALEYYDIVERIDKSVILLQSQLNSACGKQILTWKTGQ